MNIEALREHCLSKQAVTEGFPFGEGVLVFKVAEKMFLLTPLNETFRMNVKCDADRCMELRELYPEITPGYHMNKKLWNTVDLTGNITDKIILELIDHSYALVVQSLPKKEQEKLKSH